MDPCTQTNDTAQEPDPEYFHFTSFHHVGNIARVSLVQSKWTLSSSIVQIPFHVSGRFVAGLSIQKSVNKLSKNGSMRISKCRQSVDTEKTLSRDPDPLSTACRSSDFVRKKDCNVEYM